jgi:hypothetical protein
MVSRRVAQRVAAEIDVPVDTVAAVVGALHDVLQVPTDESGLARLRTLGEDAQRRAMQAVVTEIGLSLDVVSRVLGHFMGEAAAEPARDVLAMEDPVEGGGHSGSGRHPGS